ncbi:histone H1 [Limibacter armeniacum]|uniref:histone H1 n=1 Tax=Limibacter armeniacum TaxID=466084 RepID=UPI002FE6BC21
MEKFKQLVELVKQTEEDAAKFYENNVQAAGTRVRKNMQEIKKLAQDIRLEVQEIKNNAK